MPDKEWLKAKLVNGCMKIDVDDTIQPDPVEMRSMMIEAAAEIARLEKALENEHEMHMTMGSEVGANYREIGRLKEENEILKQGIEIIKGKYQHLQRYKKCLQEERLMLIKSAVESEIIIKARHKEELEQLKASHASSS